MKTKVETTTECGRCAMEHKRDGAEPHHPPIGWAALELCERLEGSGWTNNNRLFDDWLCPTCWGLVLEILGEAQD